MTKAEFLLKTRGCLNTYVLLGFVPNNIKRWLEIQQRFEKLKGGKEDRYFQIAEEEGISYGQVKRIVIELNRPLNGKCLSGANEFLELADGV